MARKRNRSESRLAQRQRLLHAARSMHVGNQADVAVVGGGAAGLVAAITAAEAGASVVVLERDLACGRSLLATGGGRCNFANLSLSPHRYNQPAFVEQVCGEGWLGSVLSFFRASGLRWVHEEDRLYPQSRSAASVRNVLLARARRAGVMLAPAREARGIRLSPTAAAARLELAYAEPWAEGALRQLSARAVILAGGGAAIPALEGIDAEIVPPSPTLCPLSCEDSPLLELDGRRVHAVASLTRAGAREPWYREQGEVLLRSYGLSGIVIFNLSRRAQQGDLIELDLAPELSAHEIVRICDPAGTCEVADGALDGVLDPAIAAIVVRLAREGWEQPWPGRTAAHALPERAAQLAKALPFVVRGPAEGEQAQVMRGGLAVGQLNAASLGFRAEPSLLACGEAVDVDGDCGGFNLAWAWKSGLVAGAAAARR